MFSAYLKEKEEFSQIFESTSQVSDFSDKFIKSSAVDVFLAWLNEGEFTLEALNAYIFGIADIDSDGELTEEEKSVFEVVSEEVVSLFRELGAGEDSIEEFLADGDGDALAEIINDHIEDEALSDNEIRENFISKAITEKTKVVIRNGIKKRIKVPVKKKRLSAAQKTALKKARLKAFSGAAKLKRAKSNNKRKKMGL